jgi:hypothetical protein
MQEEKNNLKRAEINEIETNKRKKPYKELIKQNAVFLKKINIIGRPGKPD